ncbi:MAG: RNA methyltransferase [Ignavibacteriae bacterium]|nr:RNA methyltransferase [Ignavibacteriota bacterium]
MPSYAIHKIQTLDLPELLPYRTLRRPLAHLQQGIFVAEGEKVVRRFLASKWGLVSLLLTQEWFDALLPDTDQRRLESTDIFVGDKKLLETIVGFPLHQGIMAVGKVPSERSLADVAGSLPNPHFLVALDGLVHAENVGVVVRNSAGFGVDGILVGPTSASPYLRRAVRNSMGGVFKISVLHVEDLAAALDELKRNHGTRIIIADAHATQTIHEADFGGNICVVLGNEDAGTSADVEKVATDRISIPMHKSTDSLNVASASAVMLYEARRNRG